MFALWCEVFHPTRRPVRLRCPAPGFRRQTARIVRGLARSNGLLPFFPVCVNMSLSRSVA